MDNSELRRRLQNQVLLTRRSFLCEKLEPDKYYALLRQERIFDQTDEEEIRSKPTRYDKASLLLDKLEGRDDAYEVLTRVLERIPTGRFVLEKLRETFRVLSNEQEPSNESDV